MGYDSLRTLGTGVGRQELEERYGGLLRPVPHTENARGTWWITVCKAILHECPDHGETIPNLHKPKAVGDYLQCPRCLSKISAP